MNVDFTRYGALASLIALAATVAGCNGGDTVATDASSLPPSNTGPPSSAPIANVGAGDQAVWTIDPDEPPSSDSSTFPVLVTRVGCSGGVTGEVLDPVIVNEPSRVVITFTVASLGPGAYDCPDNEAVRTAVTLDEPLGGRNLVDGACLDDTRLQQSLRCDAEGVRYEQSR